MTSKDLASEAQDLLDDMCALLTPPACCNPRKRRAYLFATRLTFSPRYEPPTSNVPRARPLNLPNPVRRSPVEEGILNLLMKYD